MIKFADVWQGKKQPGSVSSCNKRESVPEKRKIIWIPLTAPQFVSFQLLCLKWLQRGVVLRLMENRFLQQGQTFHWLEESFKRNKSILIKILPVQAVGIVTSPVTVASVLWSLRLRWGLPRAALSSSVHWFALNKNSSLAAVTELQTAHIRLSLWIVLC